MTCERFNFGGGTFTLCNRGKRWPHCSVPGCNRRAPNLCDFPVSSHKSGTCDAKLCEAHAVASGQNVHYCPPHARQLELQLGGAP